MKDGNVELKLKNLDYRRINIDEFDYALPKDRIALYPVKDRDMSKLLVLKNGKISDDIFRNIHNHIAPGSLLVFNNSRVIRARLLFGKITGAKIEVLCLEPLAPSDYELSFSSTQPVEWKCIIGNLKKWKNGAISLDFKHSDRMYRLTAEKVMPEDGETWRIRFSWDSPDLSFGEVTDSAGHIPLPPYIVRTDEEIDAISYQTIYSRVKGSVAAPTAGLHFTERVFETIESAGIQTAEITLHVGAGTFQPVKAGNIAMHRMHCEHFTITLETIGKLLEHEGRIIPVGTTSVRTIETLYWLGVRILSEKVPANGNFSIGQWDPYHMEQNFDTKTSLEAIRNMMIQNNLLSLYASTSIMIVPGYRFRLTNGIITNFHQPRSTLLLLISAWTGEKWKEIYYYALEKKFRFLSYGDCSLLYR